MQAKERTIDARGSFCPGPPMEMIRGIEAAEVGDVVGVATSDSGSRTEFRKWAEKAGHQLLSVEEPPEGDHIRVRKAKQGGDRGWRSASW